MTLKHLLKRMKEKTASNSSKAVRKLAAGLKKIGIGGQKTGFGGRNDDSSFLQTLKHGEGTLAERFDRARPSMRWAPSSSGTKPSFDGFRSTSFRGMGSATFLDSDSESEAESVEEPNASYTVSLEDLLNDLPRGQDILRNHQNWCNIQVDVAKEFYIQFFNDKANIGNCPPGLQVGSNDQSFESKHTETYGKQISSQHKVTKGGKVYVEAYNRKPEKGNYRLNTDASCLTHERSLSGVKTTIIDSSIGGVVCDSEGSYKLGSNCHLGQSLNAKDTTYMECFGVLIFLLLVRRHMPPPVNGFNIAVDEENVSEFLNKRRKIPSNCVLLVQSIDWLKSQVAYDISFHWLCGIANRVADLMAVTGYFSHPKSEIIKNPLKFCNNS